MPPGALSRWTAYPLNSPFSTSTNAPLVDLHARVSERMRAVNKLMTLFTCSRLSDSDPRDLGNIAAISRLLLQDASDMFDVIETRGLEAKHMAS